MALRPNSKVVSPEETQEQVEETNTEPVAASEEKAVATTNTTRGVAVSDGPVMPAIAALENAMDPELYGNTFNRIVGTNGALYNGKDSYGEFVDVNVVSHSQRWFVTPVAEEKDTEAKSFCRASYDGKTIPDRDGGPSQTIDEYIESMSDEYEEFRTSKYHDIYVIVLGAEKNSDKAEAAGILQVSCSPTSIKGFNAFKMQTKLYVARGQMLATHQNIMRIRAIPEQNKQGKNYVRMAFEPVPVDQVVKYEPVVI